MEKEALESNDLGRLRRPKRRQKLKGKNGSKGGGLSASGSNSTSKKENTNSFFRTHTSVMYGMLVSALGVIVGFAWRDAIVTEMEGTPWMRKNGYLVFAVFITIVGAMMMIYLNRRMRHNRKISKISRENKLLEYVIEKKEEELEKQNRKKNTRTNDNLH